MRGGGGWLKAFPGTQEIHFHPSERVVCAENLCTACEKSVPSIGTHSSFASSLIVFQSRPH